MMDPQVGQSLDGPSFCLWTISSPCSFAQEYFWVTNFEMSWWDHPLKKGGPWGSWECGEVFLSTGGGLYRFYLSILCAFQLKSSPLGPGSLMLTCCLCPSGGYPQFLTLPAIYFCSISRPSVPPSYPHQYLTLPPYILPLHSPSQVSSTYTSQHHPVMSTMQD